jgi:serine/threonine-protein kinase
MSRPLDCPGTDGWQALLAVALPRAEQERLERHLESCPACQERLRRPEEGDDALLGMARQAGDPTLVPADPTLAPLLERLHEIASPPRTPPAEAADLSFLAPGSRPGLLGILGRYEVQEVLGRGGMGVVLKALDPDLGRLVAIKVLAPALAGSAVARVRFTREAQAAAAVRHEHVVAVHRVAEAGGLPYLVMQYVAGESLQARLNRAAPLEVTEVVRIGYEAASGLAAAHAQGLIHRDIKPANLLLEDRSDGRPACRLAGEPTGEPPVATAARVKISDFGLARAVDDVGLTQAGVVAGTPEYMAPEQARGEPVDHRADLFSLGAVLYACCTGAPPFRGETPLAVLREVREKVPVPVRTLNPRVPAWLEQFIARLLARNPTERLPSAAGTAALLEGYLAHLRQPASVPAPPLSPATQPGEQAVRRPSRLAYVSAGFLACLLLGLGAVALVATGASGEPGDVRNSYDHDFRGQPLPPELGLFGESDDQFLKPEPEGLRITIPATYLHSWGGVGLLTRFGFRGDFEVTTTVQILHADVPPGGYGVGVGMRLQMADPSPEGATLARVVRAEDGQVLVWDRAIGVPGSTEPEFEKGAAPCTDTVVRLRLRRTGTTLHYLWAPGTEGDTFQEIHQSDSSADDVKSVRLTALTGRQPCNVDVRLLDFRVRATGRPAAGQRAGRRGWLTAAGLLVLAFLAAVGVWLWVRPGRRPGRAETERQSGAFRRLARGLWPAALLLPASLALTAWLMAQAPAPGGGSPKEMVVDFRGRPLPREIEPLGPLVERFVHVEAEGLRIALPRDRDDPQGATVAMPLALAGDCELTAAMEILQAEAPPPGARSYGVGVLMSVNQSARVGASCGPTASRWLPGTGGPRWTGTANSCPAPRRPGATRSDCASSAREPPCTSCGPRPTRGRTLRKSIKPSSDPRT